MKPPKQKDLEMSSRVRDFVTRPLVGSAIIIGTCLTILVIMLATTTNAFKYASDSDRKQILDIMLRGYPSHVQTVTWVGNDLPRTMSVDTVSRDTTGFRSYMFNDTEITVWVGFRKWYRRGDTVTRIDTKWFREFVLHDRKWRMLP